MQNQAPTTRQRIRYLTWSLVCAVLLFMLGISEIIYGNITNRKWIAAGILSHAFQSSVVVLRFGRFPAFDREGASGRCRPFPSSTGQSWR
jgi:hypothetical protein